MLAPRSSGGRWRLRLATLSSGRWWPCKSHGVGDEILHRPHQALEEALPGLGAVFLCVEVGAQSPRQLILLLHHNADWVREVPGPGAQVVDLPEPVVRLEVGPLEVHPRVAELREGTWGQPEPVSDEVVQLQGHAHGTEAPAGNPKQPEVREEAHQVALGRAVPLGHDQHHGHRIPLLQVRQADADRREHHGVDGDAQGAGVPLEGRDFELRQSREDRDFIARGPPHERLRRDDVAHGLVAVDGADEPFLERGQHVGHRS
mmetsp:Transcript_7643/g.21204  ORF Transcript_7643/g.21204 Transcript_7643/m.21204 type:complete len:260 (-) Transcript_7643:382-1161(-)